MQKEDQKQEEPKSQSKQKHLSQKLSKKWLEDPIKKKYVSGEVGSLTFFCKVCQTALKCESCFDHVAMHEKANAKSDPSQPDIQDFQMKNCGKQHFELEIVK